MGKRSAWAHSVLRQANRGKLFQPCGQREKGNTEQPVFPFQQRLLQLQAQGVVDQDDTAKGKLFIYGHPITSFTLVLL